MAGEGISDALAASVLVLNRLYIAIHVIGEQAFITRLAEALRDATRAAEEINRR